jgi:phenylalanyl-tRNA synthetase beta chain
MKLSLAWIFDHIDADWQAIDVAHLVAEFNKKTAEIEDFYAVEVPIDQYTIVTVEEITPEQVRVQSHELRAALDLPLRSDAQAGTSFLIRNQDTHWRWATTVDFGSHKEFLLPALSCEQTRGIWKRAVEVKDWIIEVDNKSINHRPDLWGHRGIAREVATIFDLPFKPLEKVIAGVPIMEYAKKVAATSDQPFTITLENQALCKRFAATYIPSLHTQPTPLWMAHRLARVGSRSINATVDLTNYVMLDISQPMHAFDADKISTKALTVRLAKPDETITLLDEEKVALTAHDLVVTDTRHPIALAGVMGGRSCMIDAHTKAVLIESASFDAAAVRKTALRVKKRTEASARFEKNLDPNQNTQAIERFLKLAIDNKLLSPEQITAVRSLGANEPEKSITIAHAYIQEQLGVSLEPTFVISLLKKLGFGVYHNHGHYTITVPTYRGTKDITRKEDIVEEVGRFYGYTNIPAVLPTRKMNAFDLHAVMRMRTIKKVMAYGLSLKEVWHYAFFDEEFLHTLGWKPQKGTQVQSPVSENWQQLVTTLIPGLLKVVGENAVDHEQLGFFEWGRVWHTASDTITEKQMLAGCWFGKSGVDFYEAKARLAALWDALGLTIQWKQFAQPPYPWFAPYQTAQLLYKDTLIGIAGKMHPSYKNALIPGDCFLFELDGDFLLDYRAPIQKFQPLSKYQTVYRDISLLVPCAVTVEQLIERIAHVDPRIVQVELIDFFQKEEWKDQKSITLRYALNDPQKTFTSQEIDELYARIVADLKAVNAIIR